MPKTHFVDDGIVRYCHRCGEKLNNKRIVWLELDQRDNTFTDKPVPEEFSQGGFSFGVACAKTILKNKGKKETT